MSVRTTSRLDFPESDDHVASSSAYRHLTKLSFDVSSDPVEFAKSFWLESEGCGASAKDERNAVRKLTGGDPGLFELAVEERRAAAELLEARAAVLVLPEEEEEEEGFVGPRRSGRNQPPPDDAGGENDGQEAGGAATHQADAVAVETASEGYVDATDWLEHLADHHRYGRRSHFIVLMEKYGRTGDSVADWVLSLLIGNHDIDDDARKKRVKRQLSGLSQGSTAALSYVNTCQRHYRNASLLGVKLHESTVVEQVVEGCTARLQEWIAFHRVGPGELETFAALTKLLRLASPEVRKGGPRRESKLATPAVPSAASSSSSKPAASGSRAGPGQRQGGSSGGSGRPRDGSCWSCGKSGHRRADCTERPMECYYCHKPGHLIRDCHTRKRAEREVAAENASTAPIELMVGTTEHLHLEATVVDRTVAFIVDTGADFSLIRDATGLDVSRLPTPRRLTVGNGEVMEVTEEVQVEAFVRNSVGRTCVIRTPMYLAPELPADGLLGLDFLRSRDVAVHPSKCELRFGSGVVLPLGLSEAVSEEPIALTVAAAPPGEPLYRVGEGASEAALRLIDELAQIDGLFSGGEQYASVVATGIVHTIPLKEGCVPVYRGPYRVAEAYKPRFKEILVELEERGFIKRGTSRWGCSAFVIPKGDGKDPNNLRLVVDYKPLNQFVIREPHSLNRIEDVFHSLHGSRVFSKFDAVTGYYAIEVPEAEQHKTAMTTPWGTYLWRRMSLGVSNAVDVYSRYMESLIPLDLLNKSVHVHVDDILCHSATEAEHLEILRRVLPALAEGGIQLKDSKCVFLADKLHFLGHVISGDGVDMDPAKVEAVNEYPRPETKKEVRSFLGLIRYYCRFIPQHARILAPLNALTSSKLPDKVEWNDELEVSFSDAKAALVAAVPLRFPDWSSGVILETDGSRAGIGAALVQVDDEDVERPIAFYSRGLTAAESNYGASELEALALVESVRKWEPYLVGRRILHRSDHASLKWMMENRYAVKTGKLDRWILSLQHLDIVTEHRPGVDNINADSLSRAPAITGDAAIAEAVDTYDWIDRHLDAVDGAVFVAGGEIVESNDDSTAEFLAELRELHVETGHAHTRRLAKTANEKFGPREGVWNLAARVVRECDPCSRSSGSGAIRSADLGAISASAPGERYSCDFVGPKTFNGDQFLFLTMQDVFSGFMMARAVSATSGSQAVKKARSLFRLYGAPCELHTDGGSHFTCDQFRQFLADCGVEHTVSIARHPEGNGLIERAHATCVASMMALNAEEPQRPSELLDAAVSAMNSTFSDAVGRTPFEAFLGRKPPQYATVGAADIEATRERVRRIRMRNQSERQTSAVNSASARQPVVGDRVMYKVYSRHKGEDYWNGPYLVTGVYRSGVVRVVDAVGSAKTTHTSQLKFYDGFGDLATGLVGGRQLRSQAAAAAVVDSDGDDDVIVDVELDDDESNAAAAAPSVDMIVEEHRERGGDLRYRVRRRHVPAHGPASMVDDLAEWLSSEEVDQALVDEYWTALGDASRV